jgi:hypothetical protein
LAAGTSHPFLEIDDIAASLRMAIDVSLAARSR